MVATGPVFISYSRKDYYFAESLAFHLERRAVPVWLDAKDLEPGEDWQQQLEAALDKAACVLLVVSGESVSRPSVRVEWERARKNGTRIIVVLFERARLPPELSQCELADFRAGFEKALQRLIDGLAGTAARGGWQKGWVPTPLWIAAISASLLIPLVCYFLLANWTSDAPGGPSVWLWIAVVFLAFGFFWFFCLSFLRRRMGMTHLAACFAFPAAWSLYPLLEYWAGGASRVPNVWRSAIESHLGVMELASATALAGVGIILLVRPEDLLRWTPTGKAWGWYRRSVLTPLSDMDKPSALRQVKRFVLLHDAADVPAANRLRKQLSDLGAVESLRPAPDDTTILLLTSRSGTQWLTEQSERLGAKVLTVVGSRIGLPEQLQWLWKREWIDFRHWDLRRLDRRRGLLQVPEAVTGVRYPVVVRIAHHLLCALTALAFCLFGLADPDFNQPGRETTNGENLAVLVICAICLLWGILAQRLLNRNVSQAVFEKAGKLGSTATYTFTIVAIYLGGQRHVDWWRLASPVAFLIAFPVIFLVKRDELAFWFPTPGMGRKGSAVTLKSGRQWQTLLWTAVYLFVWNYLTDAFK